MDIFYHVYYNYRLELDKLMNYDNDDNDTSVASWNETKWLTLSSCFFIIPTLYSYQKNLKSYSLLIFFTAMVSVNYWRSAKYGWRRKADLFFSRIAFMIFFYNFIFYVKYKPYILFAYPNLLIIAYCYYMSTYLHKKKIVEKYNDFLIEWWHYHVIFHICLIIKLMIILNVL
jgi:hypothetical protein